MEISPEQLRVWLMPAIWVVVGVVLGLLADFVLHRYFRRMAALTPWRGDDLIVKHLARRMPLIGLLVGILVALPQTPLTEKISGGLVRAVHVALVFVITWIGAGIVGGLIGLSTEDSERRASTSIFKVLGQVAVWGVGLTAAMHELGISIAPMLTALGVSGLALALALQDTLSNLFAGIQILLAKQLRVGDYIRLESGQEGYVTDINWRNTTIRAPVNNLIVVPNAKLATTVTTNFHLPETPLAVLVEVGVAYRSDLEQAERVIVEVAREVMKTVDGGVPEFVPVVRYHTFAESGINLTTVLRAREVSDQYLIKHEFIKRLQKRFAQDGIEMLVPRRTVTLLDQSVRKAE